MIRVVVENSCPTGLTLSSSHETFERQEQQVEVPPRTREEEAFSGEVDSDIETSMPFTVDLQTRCMNHFEFLKTLHEAGVTRRVTSESQRRYLLWLNLLLKYYVVPPKDVAWLWHCHRLAPRLYEKYLKQMCSFAGKSPECVKELMRYPERDPYKAEPDIEVTVAWKKHYPNESYELDTSKDALAAQAITSDIPITLCGFDLLASAKRQAEFYWQIRPFFQPSLFAARLNPCQAERNYRRFIKLMQKHPKAILVPTYEIDLMWHTHMTSGSFKDYYSDCQTICGRLIDHDDDFGDGNREGVLGDSFLETARLWKKAYGTKDYAKNGGYRGPPPLNYFPEALNLDPERAVMTLQEYEVRKRQEYEARNEQDGWISKKWKKSLTIAAIFFLVIGAIFLIMGRFLVRPTGYVCGNEAPSVDEIASRGAPACLMTSTSKAPLCLKAGEDPTSPPVWCHTLMPLYGDSESQNWYLWWSPCSDCSDSAWRMYEKIDDSKSRYKSLEPTPPQPSDRPYSYRGYADEEPWLKRDYRGKVWYNVEMSIEECPGDVNENGIPSACFAPKEVLWVGVTGAVLLAIPVLPVFFYSLFVCTKRCINGECLEGGGYGGGGGKK